MRGPRALLAGVALAVGLLAAMPSPVSACTGEQPSFLEAVRGARAIARVTIVEGFDTYTDDPTTSETYRVDRVLKGTLPQTLTLAPAWTSVCHDSVGYNAGVEESDGKTIVLAIDMPYYDQTIHPMWMTYENGEVGGSAGVPPGVTTLDALEAAVLAVLAPPDTATSGTAPDRTPTLPLLLVAALVAFTVTVRKSGRGVHDR